MGQSFLCVPGVTHGIPYFKDMGPAHVSRAYFDAEANAVSAPSLANGTLGLPTALSERVAGHEFDTIQVH
jgi:hypothetical protein